MLVYLFFQSCEKAGELSKCDRKLVQHYVPTGLLQVKTFLELFLSQSVNFVEMSGVRTEVNATNVN